MTAKKRLGLIVNPVAGIGGRVGLKGSDGADIQQKARGLGAVPESLTRTIEALRWLDAQKQEIEIVTYPAEMGEHACAACGLECAVIGAIRHGETTAADTWRAAQDMRSLNVDLILFAGGDGTARDIADAIADTVPVVGIPAGVKIQSAVYAVNPASAGLLARGFLRGEMIALREAEVLDLDEDAYRRGIVSPRLYGYLRIPFRRDLVQARKTPSPLSTQAAMDAIAQDVIDGMQKEVLYIVGPGMTTRPILTRLGLPKTLIGVDAVQNRRLVAADASESTLLHLVRDRPGRIVVTPIGGQGFVFGRGNQQISPAVIRAVGRDNIVVVSTLDKILSLEGRPLLVDTGDREVDRMLSGHVRIITAYREWMIYRIQAPSPAT